MDRIDRPRTGTRRRPAPMGLALAAALVALPLALATPPLAEADGVPHLRLDATSPAADTVITDPPEEVRLWFSEAPAGRGTTVRLADSGGELVPTTDVEPDQEDPSQLFIRPEAPLLPGEYTVHWRVIARDGHAQNGTFAFELRRP